VQVEVVQPGGGDLDHGAAGLLRRVVEVADPRSGPVLVEDRRAQAPQSHIRTVSGETAGGSKRSWARRGA
jgi:hypothetical protein